MPSGSAPKDSASLPHDLSVEDYFALAWRFLPEELLDARGREHIVERVRALPGSALAGSIAGIELRLGEVEASADFGVALSAPSPLADHYVEHGRRASASPRAMALGTFISRLDSEGWPSACSLEYDVYGLPGGERPDPGLFISVAQIPENAGVPSHGDVVDQLADALCLPRDDKVRESVEGVCEALPAGALVEVIGAMPSRGVRAVRLSLTAVAARDVAGFLRRLGWSGPIPLAEETLMDVLDIVPSFYVALDVGPDGPLPGIGFGLSPFADGDSIFSSWHKSSRSAWQPCIEHLVEREWSLADKGDALVEFCGVKQLVGSIGVVLLFQLISHVKITVSHDGVKAKAYAYTVMSVP